MDSKAVGDPVDSRHGNVGRTWILTSEPEILRVADFASARGQRILEIWVGMGAVGEPAGGRRTPLVQ